MRAKRNIPVAGAWLAALFIATLAAAQEKIADGDLLKLLETVGRQQTAEPAVEEPAGDPLARVLESVKADEEPAAETNEAPAVAVVPIPAVEVTVDDMGMEPIDVIEATTVGNLISVRLNKVGIEEAINLFAQLSGANIIVPELPEAAQISVNLKDVEWQPALQSILDTYNYELYQRVSGANVYSVRRRPEGAPEPQVVETFTLNYATVPNAAALIRDLLPASAKVSEFASRNMIVVKSTASSLAEVRSVLETIDTVRQQVFIESKFMELTDDAQKDLGIDWQVLSAYSIGTSGASTYNYSRSATSDKTTTRLLDASGEAYAEAESFVDGDTLSDGVFPVYEGLTPLVSDISGDGVSEVLASVLEADEFNLVLSALEDNSGVNIVSNPKIIVANEEKANISIVEKEPNVKQERQQTSGGDAAIDNTVYSLDDDLPFFEFGIKLEVTPSINTSSNITVQINPSLTRKTGDKAAQISSDSVVTYPFISEKSIETIFNLASGQTAAIGGLTEITESEVLRKVPVLGSIPLLGRLFSWEQTVRGQDETIIFVTVGLANTQEINAEAGMPADAELARRRVIYERNNRRLRDQGRTYYKAEEADRLEDMLKLIEQKEQTRVDLRLEAQQKEQENEARQAAKRKDVVSVN